MLSEKGQFSRKKVLSVFRNTSVSDQRIQLPNLKPARASQDMKPSGSSADWIQVAQCQNPVFVRPMSVRGKSQGTSFENACKLETR